jgi:curli production assembly/transport component CsgF
MAGEQRRQTGVTAVAIGAAMAVGTPAAASPLTYTPTNPSFGGNPFNSAHLLGVASAINKYQDPAEAKANDPATQFVQQLQSRLLSTVASQIADKIFGANPAESGHFTFGDQTIDFVRGVESVTLTIFNTATNAKTTISLPLLGG